MGENIIERVRLAVVGAILSMERDVRVSELTKDEERSIALAVLAALREPSDAMIRAGTIAWRKHNNSDDPYDNEIRDILVAAIDTILTEGNEG